MSCSWLVVAAPLCSLCLCDASCDSLSVVVGIWCYWLCGVGLCWYVMFCVVLWRSVVCFAVMCCSALFFDGVCCSCCYMMRRVALWPPSMRGVVLALLCASICWYWLLCVGLRCDLILL